MANGDTYSKAFQELQDKRRQVQQGQTGVTPPPPGLGLTPPGQPTRIAPFKPGATPAPGAGPTPAPTNPQALSLNPLDYVEPSTLGATAAEAVGMIPHPAFKGVGLVSRAALKTASAISHLPAPVKRFILTAIGGGTGEKLAGGDFTAGAVKEGGSQIASELGMKGVVKTGQAVLRNYPGNKMARQVGKLAEKVGGGPEGSMAGARTPAGLGGIGARETTIRQTMSRIQEQTTTKAQGLLPSGTTFLDPTRAALTAPGADMTKVKAFLSANPNLRMTPDELLATPWGAQMFAGGAPPMPKRYTLDEMNGRLQELGERGWPSRFEVSPTLASGDSGAAAAARKEFAILRNHLKREMESHGAAGAEAFNTWDGGRQVRNGGLALLEVIQRGGWLEPGRNTARLNTVAFQKAVRENLDNLEHRLPPDDFKRLKAVVFRNADPMTGDVPHRGATGRVFNPMSYTGTEPFSPGEWGQILVNTIVSAALDQTGLGTVARGAGSYGAGLVSGAPPMPTSPQPPSLSIAPQPLAGEAAIRDNADAAEANAKEKTAAFRRARENAANR